MAAEAITKMLANPDLLSDPTFLVAAGAITLSAVALTCLCLPSGNKKIATEVDTKEEEEPKLKYVRLTSSMGNVYRNGDATSTAIVVGDKMVHMQSLLL